MPRSSAIVTVPDSERYVRLGAHEVGPVDPESRLEVTVYVRHNPDAQRLPSPDEIGALPPQERRLPSDEEFFASFGASAEDIAKVVDFARSHKLQVEEASQEKASVRLSGSARAMQAAFTVELNRYEYQEGTYRGRTGAVHVPKHLAGIVEAVLGLDDRPTGANPRLRRSPLRLPLNTVTVAHTGGLPPGTHFPPQVAQLYSYPPGTDGRGQCVGILAFNDPGSHGGYRPDALSTYFQQVLQQPMPEIVDVVIDGPGNDPGDDSGADPADTTGEVMLDICTVGGTAPGAKIAVYFSQFTERGWVDVLTGIVTDRQHRPSVVSISYGNPEDDPRSAWTGMAIRRVERAFAAAALRGITFLAASGDDGSRDQGGGQRAYADFPASSPHVLGVGGTRFVIQGHQVVGEVAWGTGPGSATGGGVSRMFDLPNWQQHAGVPPSANPDHRIGRGVPDVAAVGDPQTGLAIITVDGTQLAVVGGTSASAPLWAGLVARLNEAIGVPLGYVNPLLYNRLAAGVLNDVLYGSNGAYHAGPGWDPCTGLGTPNGVALLQALGGTEGLPTAVRGFGDAYDRFVQHLAGSAGTGEAPAAAAAAWNRFLSAASGGGESTAAYAEFLAAEADAIAPATFADEAGEAFRAYLQAVQREWAQLDLATVDVGGLAAIARSLTAASAQAAAALSVIEARASLPPLVTR